MTDEREPEAPHRARDGLRGWTRAEIVIVVAGILAVLWAVGAFLLLVFAAVVVAVGIDALASAVCRNVRIPRAVAVALMLVGIVAVLVSAGAVVLPAVVGQHEALWAQLVELFGVAQEWIAARGQWMEVLLGDFEEEVSQLHGGLNQLLTQLGSLGLTTFGALTSFVLIAVMASFLAVDPGLYRHGFLRLVPLPRRTLVDKTLSETAHALRWWFLAQFASMAILGILIGTGLFFIGIEFWLSLALFTALLTFIPYLGPVLAGIPVVAIGFAEGPQTGIMVLLFFLVVQNIEANVLLPLIYQMTVRVAPAVTIAAQVLMGIWFGAAGIILAAPLTVVAIVLVRKLYIEAALGDKTDYTVE